MIDREKIIEIIKKNGTYNGRSLSFDYYVIQPDDLADTLIAAGIGDVSELKNHRVVAEYSLIPEDGNNYVLPNTPLRVKQLYSGEEVEQIVKEREEYKHRAEVAERAGKIAASKVFDYTYEEAVAQAEKELAEEGNK